MDNANTLWCQNTPSDFWLCEPDFPPEVWSAAVRRAAPILGLQDDVTEIEPILAWTLGESRFGPKRYRLGAARRFYYILKPMLPRCVTRLLRASMYYLKKRQAAADQFWPLEPRFAEFQWEVLRQALILSGRQQVAFRYFWPQGNRFAFILTHDIETAEGQRLAPALADLEESLGFRSLFNFVPERYPVDRGLITDLRQRGFEIGVHGLKHNGKLFDSFPRFTEHAARINQYLDDFHARGFRSPLTLRNPQWMQALDMEYDLSFFDTDPYEPMPGGVMSIWPLAIGHFLELPYTLPQDYTLFHVVGETSPRIWLEKMRFIEKYHGMALVIIHPDYSGTGTLYQIYRSFLNEMKTRDGYWHDVPGAVADWWRNRADTNSPFGQYASAALNDSTIQISIEHESSFPVMYEAVIASG